MIKKWDKLDYYEKISRSNNVRAICSLCNIEKLKEVIPTVDELLAYEDMSNGGSILHSIIYSQDPHRGYQHNQLDFLKQIIEEYGLEQNEELWKSLLLRRDINGRYADNINHIVKYLSPDSKRQIEQSMGRKTTSTDVPDTRTEFEKNKVNIYNFLKEEIVKISPKGQKSDVHKIGEDYALYERNSPEKSGTPITPGLYLLNGEGKPAFFMLGSIKEVYPEIRLRNVGKNGEDGVAVIKNLDPNSSKSLAEQVFEKMDYPEDFTMHFEALQQFEQIYQNMRANPYQFAYMRNFVHQRGALVFEYGRDPEVKGNSKEGVDYAGYAVGEYDNGKEYSCIVIRSECAYKHLREQPTSALLHELYHRVDLGNKQHLSSFPITEYVLLLSEQDPNNPIKSSYDVVNRYYPPSEYKEEMLAQIMSIKDKSYLSSSPLLSQFYGLGNILAIAQVEDYPAVINRIKGAIDLLPSDVQEQLKSNCKEFMDAKIKQYKEEENIIAAYSGIEQEQKLALSRAEFKRTMVQKNQQNEPQRKKIEEHLRNCIDTITRHFQILLDNPELSKIEVPLTALKFVASSVRPIEEVIAPYYGKEFNTDNLEQCTKRLSVIKKFQKGDKIYHLYAAELIKIAYISEQLYKQNGYKGCPPEPLPSFSKMQDEMFKTDPNQVISSLHLFTEAIKSGASENQLRASVFCNKPIAELTDEDFLRYNINDANNQRYIDKLASIRPRDEINEEINKGIKTMFKKAGYQEEEIPDFFAISEDNYRSVPLYKNIETILSCAKKGYSAEVLQEIFTIAATKIKNADISIEEYIKNVPESVKYKQKSIHNNVDRGKE